MSFYTKAAERGGKPLNKVLARAHTTAHTWAAPPSVSARRPMRYELHCALALAVSNTHTPLHAHAQPALHTQIQHERLCVKANHG